MSTDRLSVISYQLSANGGSATAAETPGGATSHSTTLLQVGAPPQAGALAPAGASLFGSHFPAPHTLPPVPESLSDLGIPAESVLDLMLKTLYVQGVRSGQQLTDFLCLPFPLVDERLHTLQQRRMIEVKGTGGQQRGSYFFDLTLAGRERAREALEANQYVGPLPVPLEQYRAWILRQTIRNVSVTRERIRESFQDIVLEPAMLEMLGPAINSAKSLFLYGDAGNGKTLIAECIARMLGGAMYLPYAVDIEGQVMVVYDPVYHRMAGEHGPAADDQGPSWLRAVPTYDRRFACVTRPVVVVGGELTLEQLDLQYDHHTKMYQAPFQVKANGGVLIIDDFGRQRVAPRDLLNRWIVPLEKRLDYLTLHTGSKFPVPFDCLLIFNTNLDPKALAEEAFLRRIHYKIQVENPTRNQYVEIFRRCCSARSIPFDLEGIKHIYRRYYQRLNIPPRSCHPRDILDHVCDVARYLELAPTLTPELLDRACDSYFLDTSVCVPDLEFTVPSTPVNPSSVGP